MMGPGEYQQVLVVFPISLRSVSRRTGPTKSGIKTTKRPMFPRMKKKPSNVTMFGASHSGKSSTAAFHCNDGS